jgi:hypothetical protein
VGLRSCWRLLNLRGDGAPRRASDGEIGVRMTMGAQPADITRLVLKEGLSQAAIGLALGIGAAILLVRPFRTMCARSADGSNHARRSRRVVSW